jgi:hypothetical protein
VPGLVVLDPTTSVQYYRGRWRDPTGLTGRFVGRRQQAFGAKLWCYVELCNGQPDRYIDLPCGAMRFRGCDEAWRLQAAIDYEQRHPQRFRLRQGLEGTTLIDVFSPIPSWAQRRWTIVGEAVARDKCLMSFRFSRRDIEEETHFAEEYLWLRQLAST